MAAAMACAAAPACRVSLSLGSSSVRSMKGMASSCAAAVAPLRSSFRGIALSGCRTSSSISSGGAGTAAQRNMAPIVAAAGYKLKSHKASAKRFRVTGSGKIVRRQAGKAHLLRKKTTKRRNRLTGLTEVFRGDYDNVIGALPYLKVVR